MVRSSMGAGELKGGMAKGGWGLMAWASIADWNGNAPPTETSHWLYWVGQDRSGCWVGLYVDELVH